MKIAIPVLAFSAAGGMRVLSRLADTFIANGHEVVFSHLISSMSLIIQRKPVWKLIATRVQTFQVFAVCSMFLGCCYSCCATVVDSMFFWRTST